MIVHRISAQPSDCLFKNPLCFYSTDILVYLQVMHKHQLYKQMIPFMYGSQTVLMTNDELEQKLSKATIGYSFNRVGVMRKGESSWSLTYQRTILGTEETFTVDCALVNDTCRIYVDSTLCKTVFERWE